MIVVSGLDVLMLRTEALKGRRIGILANHSAVTKSCVHAWDALAQNGVSVQRIFSPEHGLFGTQQDQIEVTRQPQTGTEIVSLYGKDPRTLQPDPALLEDLDLILCDIQDVGSRYYTFVNTMALFMERVAGRDLTFMVLDRPNPLGGVLVEGPGLCQGFESFVGVHPVPVRHGLTAGELASQYARVKNLDLDLKVIRMEGWRRSMSYQETGLPWVPPSPNMPSERTALVYPGMCLLEGTLLSEGRGTTTPFELIGADYISGEDLARDLNRCSLPGIKFRPMYFTPTFHKFANSTVGGVFLHVTDQVAFRPFLTGVAVVKACMDLYPGQFAFRREAYEFVRDRLAFDLLAGSSEIRLALEQGRSLEEIEALWVSRCEEFVEKRQPFLLYQVP